MPPRLVLSIDQGTTSTRALVVSTSGEIVASRAQQLAQHYPQDGWVEHDGEEIWQGVLDCVKTALEDIDLGEIAGIGIANQRETTLLWDRASGKPLHPAIVWQDRRTQSLCDQLVADGREKPIQDKTGLVIDPYFSATKLAWLLEHVPDARENADKGKLAFGTVDTWLISKLTGGELHVTDATNASRTMLYNIASGAWDTEILSWLKIPRGVLPEVKDSAAAFGFANRDLFGARLPILGVAGDQQAAAIGQACFKPGMVKSTYGTGCFMLLNTGDKLPRSKSRLLGTIAYRLDGETSYALEGSIFMAGGILEWLQQIGIVATVSEAASLAALAKPESRCYLVPAFTGLGAPYWSSDARGALFGMTRDTGAAEIASAALDATCYETRDLLEAMAADTGVAIKQLRVDGGMAKSDYFLGRLADLTGVEVVRAESTEATALGAAYLAGLQAGLFNDIAAIERLWKAETSFIPRITDAERNERYYGWKRAVERTLEKIAV